MEETFRRSSKMNQREGKPSASKEMRSTLSIRMFKDDSELQRIENELKATAKAIIEEYKNLPAMNYREQFNLGVKLKRSILHAKQNLKAVFRYPAQVEQMFEKMCKKTHNHLLDVVGEQADKFDHAYKDSIQQPVSKTNIPISGPR